MLDSTMDFEITGPGGGGSAPSSKEDTLMESNIGPVPSTAGSPGRNKVPSVGKAESSDIIKSVFYDETKGSPGNLDSTLDDVLQISFDS